MTPLKSLELHRNLNPPFFPSFPWTTGARLDPVEDEPVLEWFYEPVRQPERFRPLSGAIFLGPKNLD